MACFIYVKPYTARLNFSRDLFDYVYRQYVQTYWLLALRDSAQQDIYHLIITTTQSAITSGLSMDVKMHKRGNHIAIDG